MATAEALLDLQPLLFADGFVYVRSDERHADDAGFVDFWGGSVNLRRFVPIQTLADHVRRLNRAAVHLVLDPSWPVAGRNSPDARDPLWYFLTTIVPGIERASFGQAVVTGREKDQRAELVVETDRLLDGLPAPAIPSPALCLGGGFLTLEEVRYEQGQHTASYRIDSVEGAWNTARFEEPNLGYKPSFKGGYFPVSPTDTYHDLRGEMVEEMMKLGIVVEAHHHEVATGGQAEIDMKFEPLLKMADQFMWYKYIIKNVAKRHGKTVTFMPKPIFEGCPNEALIYEDR